MDPLVGGRPHRGPKVERPLASCCGPCRSSAPMIDHRTQQPRTDGARIDADDDVRLLQELTVDPPRVGRGSAGSKSSAARARARSVRGSEAVGGMGGVPIIDHPGSN